ncbi:transposable element Tcb1 transposase [Trichonephila clavipes]|nr:transposable element Tcb1 transposase [Trichonephila clavipes]
MRKLKCKRKALGGRGKLTEAFIDNLQNYYGIAIRDNVKNLQGVIFQQDNARPPTARMPQYCLHTVTTISWTDRYADLFPIEHIWDYLGRRFGHPTSLNELEARLQLIWNEMPQNIIQNLYSSMPDRIASYIRARRVRQGFSPGIPANCSQEARQKLPDITTRVVERDTSGEIYYFLEDSRGFQTRQHGRQNNHQSHQLGVQNEANLALPPRFRQVLIESPL